MAIRYIPFDEQVAQSMDVRQGWIRSQGSAVIWQQAIGVMVTWIARLSGNQFDYDQILRAERPGGAFVPIDPEGRVGLQQVFRPQAVDQARYTQEFPNFDLGNIGRPSWEIPRGFFSKGDTSTGSREAEEETKGKVIWEEKLVSVCDNTAFSPHMTNVVYGGIDLSRPSGREEDKLEKILHKLQYYSAADLDDLRKKGELYCGITLSAIAAVFLAKPGLIR